MQRREFLGAAAMAAVGGAMSTRIEFGSVGKAGQAVEDWRLQFPALAQEINGHRLAYLDSAATTLRPNPVIDAISQFYRTENANPGAAPSRWSRRRTLTRT